MVPGAIAFVFSRPYSIAIDLSEINDAPLRHYNQNVSAACPENEAVLMIEPPLSTLMVEFRY